MSRSVTNRHFKGQKLSQLPQILTGLLAAYIVGLLVDGSVCAQTSPTPVYDPYFLPTTYQQGVPPPTYQPFPYAPPPTSVPPPVYPQTTVPGMTYPGTTVPPPVYGTPAFGAAPTTTLPPVTTLPPMTTAPPMVYNSPQTYVPGVAPPPMDPFAYNSNPYPFGTVPPTQPGMPTGTSPYGPSVYNPAVPSTLYPTNPLDPNAQAQMAGATSGPVVWWPNTDRGWPELAWSRWRTESTPGLFQHLRFRQNWIIGGDDPADLQILDSQLSTTLVWPTFLGAVMPLRISPGFDLHLWDGPDSAITGFDLPAKAYSAYVNFDFVSDIRRPAGLEVNFTAGIYTDGDNISSESWRFTGVGLGWFRLSPTNVLKLGVEYYDRIDLKMLPAVGFFLQPNNDLKIDLYFPRPRLLHRFPPRGNTEVWGYVGQEYGAGSWTIERLAGFDDQVDINDKRVVFGLEWKNPRGGTGFLEGGYVWDRAILYRSNPPDKLENSDSFMLRTGFAF
ncbi:MAG: hypothetical protein ACK493_01270 [Planctomycetota bacterium]|jgi:hypothetical protein